MNKEQVGVEKLCLACNSEPVWLDGLCQFCYEEGAEEEFIAKPKEVMPKHGQGLKKNPTMHKARLIKKSIKIQGRK